MHAPSAVPGVVEVGYERKWKAETVGEPIDGRCGAACQKIDQRLIILAMGLGLNVLRKEHRTVVDTGSLLKRCPRSRNKACRQRRRAGGRCVRLNDQNLLTGLMCRQRRDHPAGSGTDDQCLADEIERGWR